MTSDSTEYASAREIKLLFRLRLSLLVCWSVAYLLGFFWLQIDLSHHVLLPILLAYAGVIGVAAHGISNSREASWKQIGLSLCLDIAFLTVLLYFSGGWTNPLVSLYLVPVAMAATLLPQGYTLLITLLAIAGYSVLTQFFEAIPHIHHHGLSGFAIHMTGMWLTFVISALLIALLVARMAYARRKLDHSLAKARERNLRHEQIIGVATMAASAAHELGTPLATIAVIAGELKNSADNPEHQEDLTLLEQQVSQCKRILGQLRAQANSREIKPEAIDTVLHQIIDRWRVLRPNVQIKTHWLESESSPTPLIVLGNPLVSAIYNLLNNAADVSPDDIQMRAIWDQTWLKLTIGDKGPGIDKTIVDQIRGQAVLSSKPEGMGVGLLLANATVESMGGRVLFHNTKEAGAEIEIQLPLARLSAKQAEMSVPEPWLR